MSETVQRDNLEAFLGLLGTGLPQHSGPFWLFDLAAWHRWRQSQENTAQDELARASDNQIAVLYRYNQARADPAHATGKMESLYAK